MPTATKLPNSLLHLKREWHFASRMDIKSFEINLSEACSELSESDRLDAIMQLESLITEPVSMRRLQDLWVTFQIVYVNPPEGYVTLTRDVLAVLRRSSSSPTGGSRTGASSDAIWG